MRYRRLAIYGFIIIFAGAFYYSYTTKKFAFINNFVRNLEDIIHLVNPCSQPILYSIGSFDARFGISKSEFLSDVVQAKSVWEKVAGKTLLSYSPTGALKIDLIYDARQAMTDELKQQGIDISNAKATYDAIKIKYDSLVATYQVQKAEYDQAVLDFNAKQASYEKEVEYWNAKGGAPKQEYQALQQEKSDLNTELSNLNGMRNSLLTLTDEINSLVTLLNSLAQKLNLKVSTFNNTGLSNGEEFSEGEYIRDQNGTRINIYQFENKIKLLSVLEHEIGHALGLDHVLDPKAIMYRLNQSTNDQLTKADIDAFNKTCWAK
jgi:hypothetical protein